jgi:sugar phosphate isomerase/epimerase
VRLAISNLAWPIEHDTAVADRLSELGFDAVEIAPTKIWPRPLAASQRDALNYRRFWEAHGLSIVALQSLLFERPHLRIFADARQRQEATEYLTGIIRLGGWLGASVLVFGLPRNRQIAPRSIDDVTPEAVEFFRVLGDAAADAGTSVCIEPNPPAYGCDFVTRAEEALALVQRVEHPAIGLHLDTACMALAGDDPTEVLPAAAPRLRHMHVSEPDLQPVGESSFNHAPFGAAVRRIQYAGAVSIEMKPGSEPFSLDRIERAAACVRDRYFA